MTAKWNERRWGDLATLEYGKRLQGYENGTGSYPVYGTNGLIGRHTDPLCQHPGVIIGRKGAYRGVHYSDKPFFVIDTAFYLEPKVDIDLKWAYYQLLTQNINSMDSGSAIPSTSRDSFYKLPVKVPPLPEQIAIASILGALDDKIELNRKMNEILEAMARAIFKSWFVDFDSIPDLGLHKEWQDSPLGKIPKGWRVGTIGEIANVTSGKRPSKKTTETNKEMRIPLYGGGGQMGFVDEPLIEDPFLITGRVGTIGQIRRITFPCWPSDNRRSYYAGIGPATERFFVSQAPLCIPYSLEDSGLLMPCLLHPLN